VRARLVDLAQARRRDRLARELGEPLLPRRAVLRSIRAVNLRERMRRDAVLQPRELARDGVGSTSSRRLATWPSLISPPRKRVAAATKRAANARSRASRAASPSGQMPRAESRSRA
jgi:hypothetical protein